MDVDRRRAEPREEVAGEDLHVAGEDEQVDLAEQLQRSRRSAAVLVAGLDRHVVEGEADRGDLLGVVGVVGDDRDELGAELAAAPAPEQVGEAVVLARDHDRDPLALARLGEAVLHLEAASAISSAKRRSSASRSASAGGVEDHPHEEATLGGRVLVGVDDVEPGVGEEAADGRDQPRPVGAGEQQARVSACSAVDRGIIAD